jgi:hypothetical protein
MRAHDGRRDHMTVYVFVLLGPWPFGVGRQQDSAAWESLERPVRRSPAT